MPKMGRHRFTLPVLLVAWIAVGSLWLAGQVSGPKDGPVAGTIANSVSGLPVASAEVALGPTGAAPKWTTKTDGEGKFRFDHVPFGKYNLQAAKPGYARMSFGAMAVGNPGSIVAVTSDRGATTIEFRLIPLGTIQGKVINRRGDGAANVNIACGFVDVYGAPPTMEPLRAVTDAHGEYRLSEMPPGRYYVQALPMPSATPLDKNHDDGSDLPAFYPSAGTFAEAQPISLAPGQEESGVIIQLREAAVFRVRGALTGSAGTGAVSNVDLLLLPKDTTAAIQFGQGYAELLSRSVGGSSAIRPDGTFELRRVERGSYELAAVTVESRSRLTIGRTVIHVGDRDLEGVKVPVGEFVQLTVRLHSEENLTGVSCSILGLPVENNPTAGAIMGITGADGTLAIDRALPDMYAFTAKCKPGSWVVDSARIDGVAAATDGGDSGLALGAGAVSVTLTLSKEAGFVFAQVKEDSSPAPGRWLTLIPNPPRPGRFMHELSGWSDDQGRLVIQNVAPGNYRLYAWRQASGAASALHPSFLQRFEQQAVPVSLKAGEQVSVEAPTIQP